MRCAQGFQPSTIETAECLPGQKWTATDLNCVNVPDVPVLRPRTFVQQGGSHQSGYYDLDKAPSTVPSQNILRPYIKCPQDTTLLLKPNQITIYVQLEQPKSNVDFVK